MTSMLTVLRTPLSFGNKNSCSYSQLRQLQCITSLNLWSKHINYILLHPFGRWRDGCEEPGAHSVWLVNSRTHSQILNADCRVQVSRDAFELLSTNFKIQLVCPPTPCNLLGGLPHISCMDGQWVFSNQPQRSGFVAYCKISSHGHVQVPKLRREMC